MKTSIKKIQTKSLGFGSHILPPGSESGSADMGGLEGAICGFSFTVT